MDLAKRKSLMKAFITSQFSYCPLVWMFHRKELVYQDNKLTFNDLLKLDNSVTIHQRNFQIFKAKNNSAPEIMTEVFEIKEPNYNLRSEATNFKRKDVKSTHYGIQSVWHLGPKLWNIVPPKY